MAYFDKKSTDIFKSRLPWLLLLMLSATFTEFIINRFENTLFAYPLLSAFIPMLMGTGGNAGAQAAVTVIRGLSLDEIKTKDVLKVVLKELKVSLLCGMTLSAIVFLKMMTVDRIIVGDINVFISLTVSITMFITVVFAKIIGGVLPLFAKRIGLDPAVMASPFITTLTDIISLLVYFFVASTVL